MNLRWTPSRLSDFMLVILALLSLAAFYFLENSKHPVKSKYFQEKVKAAKKAKVAFEIVKKFREDEGIPIDTINDPNKTGLIGEAFTVITTKRADLSEKITAADPNMAALMVQLLKEAGLKEGDTVVISWTGSYPGINIGLLAACDVLKIRPLIITSLESSMWGANIPELTWLDMESALNRAGFWSFKSICATLGGDNDNGLGIPPAGLEAMMRAAERNGVPLISAPDRSLEANIGFRMELGEKAKAYINVGYNVASFGKPEIRRYLKPGIYRHLPEGVNLDKCGAGPRLLTKGKIMINIVEVNKLAVKYGIEPSKTPLTPIGKGKLYYEWRYSSTLAIVVAVLLIVLIYVLFHFDLPKYLLRR